MQVSSSQNELLKLSMLLLSSADVLTIISKKNCCKLNITRSFKMHTLYS